MDEATSKRLMREVQGKLREANSAGNTDEVQRLNLELIELKALAQWLPREGRTSYKDGELHDWSWFQREYRRNAEEKWKEAYFLDLGFEKRNGGIVGLRDAARKNRDRGIYVPGWEKLRNTPQIPTKYLNNIKSRYNRLLEASQIRYRYETGQLRPPPSAVSFGSPELDRDAWTSDENIAKLLNADNPKYFGNSIDHRMFSDFYDLWKRANISGSQDALQELQKQEAIEKKCRRVIACPNIGQQNRQKLLQTKNVRAIEISELGKALNNCEKELYSKSTGGGDMLVNEDITLYRGEKLRQIEIYESDGFTSKCYNHPECETTVEYHIRSGNTPHPGSTDDICEEFNSRAIRNLGTVTNYTSWATFFLNAVVYALHPALSGNASGWVCLLYTSPSPRD